MVIAVSSSGCACRPTRGVEKETVSKETCSSNFRSSVFRLLMRIVGQKDDRGDQTPVPVILVIQMEAQNLFLMRLVLIACPPFLPAAFVSLGKFSCAAFTKLPSSSCTQLFAATIWTKYPPSRSFLCSTLVPSCDPLSSILLPS